MSNRPEYDVSRQLPVSSGLNTTGIGKRFRADKKFSRFRNNQIERRQDRRGPRVCLSISRWLDVAGARDPSPKAACLTGFCVRAHVLYPSGWHFTGYWVRPGA